MRKMDTFDESKSMNVLVVEPEKTPYMADIGSDLKSMQDAVGGSIEAIYPFEEQVALVCNEDGKLLGMTLNRALRDENGEIYDILAGKFFVCGLGEDDFTSLTPELADKFKYKFAQPEIFVKLGSRIIAVPIEPKADAIEKPKDKIKHAVNHDAR
jgi:hypothetical protein